MDVLIRWGATEGLCAPPPHQGFPRDFLVGGHFFSKVPPLGGALFSQGGGAVGGH